MRKFVKALGGKKGFDRLTTKDVCDKYVMVETRKRRCAFIDLFVGKKDRSGKPYVGPATVFVSHAWKYTFAEPVDAMEQHAAVYGQSYFWFDLFVNNQHGTEERPQEWWKTTFKESIQHIGSLLVVLSPWNDPIPVKRAWCLWELMCGLSQPDVKLTMRLPMEQEEAMRTGVFSDPAAVLRALAGIHAEQAEAFKVSDKEMIFEAIEKTVGFANVNERVNANLRSWYVEKLQAAIATCYATDSVESASQMASIAAVVADMGFSSDAASFYEQVLGMRSALLGAAHIDTLLTYIELGRTYMRMGAHSKARLQFETAVKDLDTDKLSPESLSNAQTCMKIGIGFENVGDIDRAALFYDKALHLLSNTVAAQNSKVSLADLHRNLASIQETNGSASNALDLYQQALSLYLESVGPSHPNTAAAYFGIGKQCERLERDADAEEAFKKALSIRQTTLGHKHPDTGYCCLSLGHIQLRRQERVAAQAMFQQALSIFKVTLGPEHQDTKSAWGLVAALPQAKSAEDIQALIESTE